MMISRSLKIVIKTKMDGGHKNPGQGRLPSDRHPNDGGVGKEGVNPGSAGAVAIG
ncbi:hypothetical protein ACW185_02105 [Limosilactobacillus fermentum]